MNIKKMLPFLDDDDIKELAEKISASPDDTYQGLTLSQVLPFMDDDDVDDLFQERIKENKPVSFMMPFISDDAISAGVTAFLAGQGASFPIKKALPFMDDDDISRIAKKCTENGGSYQGIAFNELLPFLDDDDIDDEFRARVKNKQDYKALLPFVDDDVLSDVVDDYVKGQCEGLDMDDIYPFLDDDDIRKLFKFEMNKSK
jgi:hypothetical protein